jgi:threonine dehydratase
MADSLVPDLADVLAARQRISSYLQPTPLYRYPALDALTGALVWVKHENHQPVGAFKVRGGVNLVSQLSAGDRERGVIAASTGNHAQSIAYAAGLFGVRAVICMPEQANPVKVESVQALGAELVFYGADYLRPGDPRGSARDRGHRGPGGRRQRSGRRLHSGQSGAPVR